MLKITNTQNKITFVDVTAPSVSELCGLLSDNIDTTNIEKLLYAISSNSVITHYDFARLYRECLNLNVHERGLLADNLDSIYHWCVRHDVAEVAIFVHISYSLAFIPILSSLGNKPEDVEKFELMEYSGHPHLGDMKIKKEKDFEFTDSPPWFSAISYPDEISDETLTRIYEVAINKGLLGFDSPEDFVTGDLEGYRYLIDNLNAIRSKTGYLSSCSQITKASIDAALAQK